MTKFSRNWLTLNEMDLPRTGEIVRVTDAAYVPDTSLPHGIAGRPRHDGCLESAIVRIEEVARSGRAHPRTQAPAATRPRGEHNR